MEQFFTVLLSGACGFIGSIFAIIAVKRLLKQMDAEYKATREQARKVIMRPPEAVWSSKTTTKTYSRPKAVLKERKEAVK